MQEFKIDSEPIEEWLNSRVADLFMTLKRDFWGSEDKLQFVKKQIEHIKNVQGDKYHGLLLKAVINAQNQYGRTALMLAACDGYPDIVKVLLEAKAHPNITDNGGDTALIYATYYGERNRHEAKPFIDIVKLLLKAQADLNIENTDGATALYGAVVSRDQEMVKLLFEERDEMKQVNPNVKDITYHYTALQLAVKNGDEAIVKLLLQRKANPNTIACEYYSDTTLHLAVKVKRPNSAIVTLLLQGRAEINLVNNLNKTPLSYVINRTSEEDNHIVQILCRFQRKKTALVSCEKLLPDDLWNIIFDYYFNEEDKDQKLTPQNITKLFQIQVQDLKSRNRFFQGISCHPLVVSSISSSIGLGGLLITAFMTKDLLAKKAFYPILTLEAIFIIFMVFLTYKLSSSKEAAYKQSTIEASPSATLFSRSF